MSNPLLDAVLGPNKPVSSLRGPNPPALMCMACGRMIKPYWEHPLLILAKKKGWYHGEITGGTCACPECDHTYVQKRMAERYQAKLERAGLPLVMQQWTLSTYPGSKNFIAMAEAWCEGPARSDVVLYGPPGTGKTGLAIAMIRGLLDRGQLVRFVRASQLLLMLKDSFASKERSEQQVLQSFLQVDALLLDDLTALRKSEFFEDTLWTIIDVRQKELRPTLLTVNLTKEERGEFFGPLLFDRLREGAQWWHLDGASVRRPRR